jgi:ribosomal-protein-alanine N-acetyltransferase
MTPARPLRADDAPALARLVVENRAFLAPWDPVRPESYYSLDGQRAVVDELLAGARAGTGVPWVLLDDAGEVAGRITLSAVEHGYYRSARLGYWLAERLNGRGVATAAVRAITDHAFDVLGLHRVEATTLPSNGRSQRVLERAGFVRIGLAPRYLLIAGDWQDHVLFQLLAEDRPAAAPRPPG